MKGINMTKNYRQNVPKTIKIKHKFSYFKLSSKTSLKFQNNTHTMIKKAMIK
jgi:hypothetical protein